MLAAGHGDGVIIQNLVGHVRAGGDRGADGKAAGMGVGAVAEIDKDVRFVRRPVLADPGDAFAAHLAGHVGFPVRHEIRHIVTANTCQRARAFRYDGGGIVRAAGTIVRCTEGFRRIGACGFPGAADAVEIGIGP